MRTCVHAYMPNVEQYHKMTVFRGFLTGEIPVLKVLNSAIYTFLSMLLYRTIPWKTCYKIHHYLYVEILSQCIGWLDCCQPIARSIVLPISVLWCNVSFLVRIRWTPVTHLQLFQISYILIFYLSRTVGDIVLSYSTVQCSML